MYINALLTKVLSVVTVDQALPVSEILSFDFMILYIWTTYVLYMFHLLPFSRVFQPCNPMTRFVPLYKYQY